MTNPIYVSSSAELKTALDAATGGETIVLASGNYGELNLSGVRFDTDVTLVSADPDNQATFSDMSLRWVYNLAFDNITFDHVHEEGDRFSTQHFKVYDSEGITIRNSTFDGDTSQSGAGWGVALDVKSSKDITVENTEFYDFYRGAVFYESDGVTVLNNDVHRMSSDGMDFAAVTDVLIEGNYFHDFIRPEHSLAHADMIQFWTNGTKTQTANVIIRDNTLDIGDGMWTQSIFMRNELVDSQGAGMEMYYKDVLIEGNHIVNAHLHGISVGASDGLVIRDNSVLHADGRDADGEDSAVEIPRIFVHSAATNVSITDNVTSRIVASTDDATWDVSGNVFVQDQDPEAAGYYRDIFVDSTLFNNDGHAFITSKEGAEYLGGAGTGRMYGQSGAALTPLFDIGNDDNGGRSSYVFDASATLSLGATLPIGTVFEWDFGGGDIERGLVVSHSFATAGVHDVILTVRMPDGTKESTHAEIVIEHDLIVEMDRGSGFVVYKEGEGSLRDYEQVTEDGLQISDTGIAATIWSGHVTDIVGADSFGINLSLRADDVFSVGEVFRIHESIVVGVSGTGGLTVTLTTEAGIVRVGTTDVNFADLETHNFRLEYGGGKFSIMVDGEVNNTVDMELSLSGGGRDLHFGNPWNKQNFTGTVTDFSIDNGNDTLPEATSSTRLDDSYSIVVMPPSNMIIAAPIQSDEQKFGYHEALQRALPENGKTITIEETGVSAGVSHEQINGLTKANAFAFGFTLTADPYDAGGTLFMKYGSFAAWVKSTGELVFTVYEADGSRVNIKAADVSLLDGAPHDVVIGFEEEMLSIEIDGVEIASKAYTGTMGSNWHHDFILGTLWSKDAQAGTIENFGVVYQSEADQWSSIAFAEDSSSSGATTLGGVQGYLSEWAETNTMTAMLNTTETPSSATTQFITDEEDQFEWRDVVATYDAEGVLSHQRAVYDDGDIVEITFENGTPVTLVEQNISQEGDWQARTITYVDGEIAQITTQYDDVHEITVDYM